MARPAERSSRDAFPGRRERRASIGIGSGPAVCNILPPMGRGFPHWERCFLRMSDTAGRNVARRADDSSCFPRGRALPPWSGRASPIPCRALLGTEERRAVTSVAAGTTQRGSTQRWGRPSRARYDPAGRDQRMSSAESSPKSVRPGSGHRARIVAVRGRTPELHEDRAAAPRDPAAGHTRRRSSSTPASTTTPRCRTASSRTSASRPRTSNLGVGSGSHAAQTAEVMTKMETILLEQRPDAVLVVGDVNSTLAATIAAVKLDIPVAHVEAGLRSFDRAHARRDQPPPHRRRLDLALRVRAVGRSESAARRSRSGAHPLRRQRDDRHAARPARPRPCARHACERLGLAARRLRGR